MEPKPQIAYAKYLMVWFALLLLTGVTITVAGLEFGQWSALAAIAIATVKGTLVLFYFMHLKFEGAWKYVLLLPTAILACGLPLALAPDIGLHYYRPQVPQIQEAARQEAAHGAHHAGEGADHAGGEAH